MIWKRILLIIIAKYLQKSLCIYLKFKPVPFSAIFFYLWIYILHKCISFHQHVSKGWACKYTNDFRAHRWQLLQTPSKYPIYSFFIHCWSLIWKAKLWSLIKVLYLIHACLPLHICPKLFSFGAHSIIYELHFGYASVKFVILSDTASFNA